MDLKYIFIVIVIFIVLIVNTNPLLSKEISEQFQPIKETYNSWINNGLGSTVYTPNTIQGTSYNPNIKQQMGNDNGFFAQPGEKNCTSITKAGGKKSYPVTLSGSNIQSNFNQNGSAINNNSKTTSHIKHSQFYDNSFIQQPVPKGIFNDIYSRKKGCDKPGQLECAVKKLENAFAIPSYLVDENNRKSTNGILYGGQNPKTLVPPMVTRPAFSLDWRNSSMVVPNQINGTSNENLYLSGQLSPNDIASWENTREDEKIVENFQQPLNPRGNPRDFDHTPIVENYAPDLSIENLKNTSYKEKDWSDMVNMSNGYNSGQFQENDFPNNLPQGNCGQNKKLKEYNDRLFTSTIQPGTYYKQDVIEQINSNAGISFQQQFLPRTIKEVKGGILYEDHDPENVPELPSVYEKVVPDISNVFDPRFNGYGDQTRNYVDEMTGQPRFVYDDINNVKMPNYITRNKLDTFNFGSKYGIAEPHGKSLNDIRGKAESAFLDDSIAHRDDLTVKLMRKSNIAAQQRRQAPTRTNLR